MTAMAAALDLQGWVLRSGAAPGADSFFEAGSRPSASQIFIPWNGFQGRRVQWPIPLLAYELAAGLHPGWSRLTSGAKTLMARNCLQVLGPNLDDPSLFVLCWTQDGCEGIAERSRKTGGTGQAIALASAVGVPVINMQRPDWRERLTALLGRLDAAPAPPSPGSTPPHQPAPPPT